MDKRGHSDCSPTWYKSKILTLPYILSGTSLLLPQSEWWSHKVFYTTKKQASTKWYRLGSTYMGTEWQFNSLRFEWVPELTDKVTWVYISQQDTFLQHLITSFDSFPSLMSSMCSRYNVIDDSFWTLFKTDRRSKGNGMLPDIWETDQSSKSNLLTISYSEENHLTDNKDHMPMSVNRIHLGEIKISA